MKKISAAIGLLLILAIGVLYYMIEERTHNITQLNRLAAAGNSTVPTMVDEVTRLDSVEAKNYSLQFSYTIIDDSAYQGSEAQREKVTSWYKMSACENQQIRGALLSKGISIIYSYKNPKGDPISSFSYTEEDC